jgi:hypothetical protein
MAISAVAEARARFDMSLEVAAQARADRRAARNDEMRHACFTAAQEVHAGEGRSTSRVDRYA